MKKIVYRLPHTGALEPGHWLTLATRGDLLDKWKKGFASPLACRQAFLANHDAALTAAKVSLGYRLLVSCLAIGTVQWTIKRTEQGRLVLERQKDSLTQVVAATALLGAFMVLQGYQYHLDTQVIESSYQVDLHKCR
ncbi:hypothetical protein QMK33_09755 [Hymenobacter sp. H14-R3]|uniref:hypothetical protein n=1 Tax=Hymenobacter sp. H14-R3 TaxID=3046308 RepID=UPI0024B91257|nr:hypothetical protein [Hymenobacter sp. H14-R3]MDJ0365439.1 hypothetical protein [Hymenobacter sp. H14-R3]